MTATVPTALACSVRGCGLPLLRHGAAFACERGHSFDIARHGYVNLLQPQDRRSLNAGDSKEAIDARADLFASGVGSVPALWFVDRAAALSLRDFAVVVDLGSGAGDVLAALAARRRIAGFGLDLSVPAVERAARRHPECTWVVANLDRRLPFLNASVDLALCHHGRRSPSECARVLAPSGVLLVAVPAPDDLIEVRTLLGGSATPIDRTVRLIDEHVKWFEVKEQFRADVRQTLDPGQIRLLLQGTYRGQRYSAARRLDDLVAMDVTFASDVFVFVPRSGRLPP